MPAFKMRSGDRTVSARKGQENLHRFAGGLSGLGPGLSLPRRGARKVARLFRGRKGVKEPASRRDGGKKGGVPGPGATYGLRPALSPRPDGTQTLFNADPALEVPRYVPAAPMGQRQPRAKAAQPTRKSV